MKSCVLILLAVSTCTEAAVVRSINGVNNRKVGEKKLLATVQSETPTGNNSLDRNHHGNRLNRSAVADDPPHRRALRSTSCAQRDCKWPKAADGQVYIPYIIADHYSAEEVDVILKGIESFSVSTCIRFIPRTNQDEYIYIQSLDGCYSFVGRLGSVQVVSLSRQGCVKVGTVQHELLHVLGFDHEHCRSDRDHHIQVLIENVMTDEAFNFDKTDTLNQRTSYDYDSVMHYDRLAFSKDNLLPTMVGFPDRNATFGTAMQMSPSDIERVNLLYCSK